MQRVPKPMPHSNDFLCAFSGSAYVQGVRGNYMCKQFILCLVDCLQVGVRERRVTGKHAYLCGGTRARGTRT